MFSIIFSQLADKQLQKLPKVVQKRIVLALERIRVRPHSFVKKLVSSPYFRMRVGDYRIIIDIQKDKLIVFVVEIDHRKRIYK